MGKKIISFIIIMILFLFLFGCNNGRSSFNTKNEAKEYLLKEEGLNKENIINEFNVDSNYLIFFEKKDDEERVYGLMNFVQLEDGSLMLDDVSPKLSIKGTEGGRFVGLDHYIQQEKIINFTIGIYEGVSYEELEKDVKKGILTIDEKRGIYYIIDIDG